MPNTGVADLAGAALGMGSVVTAAGYYVSSRKALKK
jgi:LPXTG-motif cell wall-anchored protein